VAHAAEERLSTGAGGGQEGGASNRTTEGPDDRLRVDSRPSLVRAPTAR
jgi:hypothetical protein